MQHRRRDTSAISAVALVPAALMLALGLASAPAAATMITQTYGFSATNISPLLGSDPVPTDPVQGQVTVTFDPAVNVSNVTAGITLDSLNISLGSAIAFSYTSSVDLLEIGGASLGINSLSVGEDDFYLAISGAVASPAFDSLSYASTSSATTIWSADSGSVSVVPEPGTASLLGVGLLAIASVQRGAGSARQMRRRQ